ncbi:MAG: DUF1028 domain-containing protein [Gemmatimonadetes bacterium]|nr:DUF1028 domain-containing protein [Gemmatimonadota bacterium]
MKRNAACFLSLLLLGLVAPARAQVIDDPELEGTFSIIGRDPATMELGIAVHSKTIAVGSRVRGGKGGVAVFAHQAGSNPLYSTIGIELLEAGWSPQEALDFMLRGDEGRNGRQVAILDIQGRTAAWTSPTSSDWKGHKCGVDYCAQGNTLAGPEVVEAMARSFEASVGTAPLAERLLDALEAGNHAGGDRRGVQSAGLLILKPRSIQDFGDRALDLRVDEHKDPFGELRRVLNVRRASEILAGVNPRLNAKDFDGALRIAMAALEKAPDYDNVWVAIANVHLQAGRKAEALAAIRRAVELNPANKRQLPRNASFEALHRDPEFLRIVSN